MCLWGIYWKNLYSSKLVCKVERTLWAMTAISWLVKFVVFIYVLSSHQTLGPALLSELTQPEWGWVDFGPVTVFFFLCFSCSSQTVNFKQVCTFWSDRSPLFPWGSIPILRVIDQRFFVCNRLPVSVICNYFGCDLMQPWSQYWYW